MTDKQETHSMEDEGTWTPCENLDMFMGNQGIDLDKTDWDALDYANKRDYDWYKKKFPGFPDEILEILVKCDGMYEDPEQKQNTWEARRSLNNEISTRKEKHIINFD